VDIDRYIARNQAAWERLDDLTRRARRRVRSLGPDELDELIQLYQRTSAQLSYARTYYDDQALTTRLTRLVAAASGVIYGTRPRTLRAVGGFFAETFPAAVWHLRRFVGVAALVTFVPTIVVALWLINDPAALDASGTPARRAEYVDNQFEQYYSEQPSAQFFTEVTTNNIRVSFVAFALGALLCLPGALILAVNGLNLGVVSAWMATSGEFGRFLGLILPHGALELTAIVIAGGSGLALGWAIIAPGDQRRTDALAAQGRRAVVVVLGLMATFTAAGTIEGFVTGSGLPAGVRVAVGLLVWLAFVGYLAVQGRAAAARGLTGAMGERERRTRSPELLTAG